MQMELAETKSFFNGVADTWDTKTVHRVRTPAGVKKFKRPIGSIIVGNATLKNLTLEKSEYDGFDKVKTSEGSSFYIGQFPGEDDFTVNTADDQDVFSANSLEDAFKWLDANPSGKGPKTPAKKAPAKAAPKATEKPAAKAPAKKAPAKAADAGSNKVPTDAEIGKMGKAESLAAYDSMAKEAADGKTTTARKRQLEASMKKIEDRANSRPASSLAPADAKKITAALDRLPDDDGSGNAIERELFKSIKNLRDAVDGGSDEEISRALRDVGEAGLVTSADGKEFFRIADSLSKASKAPAKRPPEIKPGKTDRDRGLESGNDTLDRLMGELGMGPKKRGTRDTSRSIPHADRAAHREANAKDGQGFDAIKYAGSGRGMPAAAGPFVKSVADNLAKDGKMSAADKKKFQSFSREDQAKIIRAIRAIANAGKRGGATVNATEKDKNTIRLATNEMVDIHRKTPRTKDDDDMANLQYKAVPVSGVVEDAEDTGIVEAIVAVTGIKDNVNDIILPGAFEKSLMKRNAKGVWHHNIHESVARTQQIKELPPGDLDLPSTLPNGDPWPDAAGALKVKMEFNLGTQRGRDAYADVKFFGTDQEWSIGYNVPTGGATLDKRTGTRNIKTLDLFEYSPVLFGAMPNARTVSVKSAQEAHKVILNMDGAEGLEFKSLLDDMIAEESKAFKKKKPSADQEDEEYGDEEDMEPDDADMEDEEWDEEEEDTPPPKKKGKRGKKSMYMGADGLDLLHNAVEALSELRSHIIEEMKADDTDDDKGKGKDTGSDSDSSSLAGLVEDADLDCGDAAASFDSAVSDGDSDAMEDAGNTVLDAVESAKESGDADSSKLKAITSFIASAFSETDAEQPSEEKDYFEDEEDDTDDAVLVFDQKSLFAEFGIQTT